LWWKFLEWSAWSQLATIMAVVAGVVTPILWLCRRYDAPVLREFDNPGTITVSMVGTDKTTKVPMVLTPERIAARLGRFRFAVRASLTRLWMRRLVLENPDGTWRLRG
jgi:hypothetical protein